MKKRLLSALLALLLLPALTGEALAADTVFSDVPSDAWYAKETNWCRENGIIRSTGGNTFSPNAIMPRAMLAMILH